MNANKKVSLFLAAVLGLTAAVYLGCTRGPDARSDGQQAATPGENHDDHEDEHGHEHEPGAHGGTIVGVGADDYHVEVVFEPQGVVRLYLLDSEAARVVETDAQPVNAYVRGEGSSQAVEVAFLPDPQSGDAEGHASRFKASLPAEVADGGAVITIPSLALGGQRYRVEFETPHADPHAGLPPKATADEEQQLYLTPGGIYTEADIEANGRKVASEKFAGFKAAHDFMPKSGDRICPVTRTKANPQCTWVVGGQTYQFCCPPCVDEFVRQAKTDPADILPADEYVQP